MYNPRFHSTRGPFALEVLASIAGAVVYKKENSKLMIHGVSSIENARSGEITYVSIDKTIYKLKDSLASACIIKFYDPKRVPDNIACIISSDPHASYAKIAQKFHPSENNISGISENIKLSTKAKIGEDVSIDSFTIISDGVELGDGCVIGSGVYIGPNVKIGERTIVSSNTTIECADIGKDVLIYSGVRIGQRGFGFAPTKEGHIKIPQLGQVIIENNVEIGANCCIDRGSSDNTQIGEGTFLDNLVHVAHNVKIGKHCAIAGQVGIAGSAIIGDFCMFGGQVGIGGHVNLGSAVQAAGQTGITRNVKSGSKLGGTPAVSLTQYHRQAVKLKKISRKSNDKND